MSISSVSPRLTVTSRPSRQPDTIDDFGDKTNAIRVLDDPTTPLQTKVATLRSDTDAAMKEGGVTRLNQAANYGLLGFLLSPFIATSKLMELSGKKLLPFVLLSTAVTSLITAVTSVLGATMGFSLTRWIVNQAVQKENGKVDAALGRYLDQKNEANQQKKVDQ